MAVVAITATERAAFKRCRRAWDLGARIRRGLEPVSAPVRREHPAREALAVHYFPGMWAGTGRSCGPLVLKAAGTAPRTWSATSTGRPAVDDFEPLRVEFDFDARVPDPWATATWPRPTVGPSTTRGRAHALVVDATGPTGCSCTGSGRGRRAEVLRLDEAAVTAAWAWETSSSTPGSTACSTTSSRSKGGSGAHGCGSPGRGRPRPGAQLAVEVAEMLDPSLALYPTPGAYCAACPFVAPCMAMQDGRRRRGDARPRLPAPPTRGA